MFAEHYGTYSVNESVDVKVQVYDDTGTVSQGATRTIAIASLALPLDFLSDKVAKKAYLGVGGVAIPVCDTRNQPIGAKNSASGNKKQPLYTGCFLLIKSEIVWVFDFLFF